MKFQRWHETWRMKCFVQDCRRESKVQNWDSLGPEMIHVQAPPLLPHSLDPLTIRSSISCVPLPVPGLAERGSWDREVGDHSTALGFSPHQEADLAPLHLFHNWMDMRKEGSHCLSHSQRHNQAEP